MGEDLSICENWKEAGVCDSCIKYRIELLKMFVDHYNDLGSKHCAECTCFNNCDA